MPANQQKELKIKFKSGGLTYAEKLLLKKHRRTEMGKLPDDINSQSHMSARFYTSENHTDIYSM